MIGKRLAHYEITAELGKGGMGEVWRARDTKLGREVAIKTLPQAFSQDEARVARFEREAKLLASLNHPNIAAIYGIEQSKGTRFLVLELVEGETLAERLKRGPLSVEEALGLARQIVQALEAAHERGVIHRDLKPANVKITPDGQIKVLDFGLAKAFAGEEADANLSSSPTLSRQATMAGVILGTAAYMSPEQAKGIPVDRRSDVFSFGCVLFEMLTGRRAFPGEHAAEVLASVIAREPDLSVLPPHLHPQLRELLKRSLAKDLRNRWQAVGDIRLELEQIAADSHGAPLPPPAAVEPRSSLRRLLPFIATAVLVAAAMWILKPAGSPEPRLVGRFSYELPPDQVFTNIGFPLVALSPSGDRFVYVANSQLYVRSLSQLDARPIPGTDVGSTTPVVSPGGEWVAYWAGTDETLKKIPIGGGASVTLCEAENPFGMSWAEDDTLVYGQTKGIFRVPGSGGAPTLLVAAEEGERVYGPQILPGGRSVLFTSTRASGGSRWDEADIVVQSLDSGERKILWKGGSDARYVPTGPTGATAHLVFARGNEMFAVALDLARLEVKGAPVRLDEHLKRAAVSSLTTGTANYDLSKTGSLVHVAGSATKESYVLAFADAEGHVDTLDVPKRAYVTPRLSPDGKRLVVETDDDDGSVLWLYDLSGGTAMRRFTFEGNNTNPVWTPDGKRITFASDRDGIRGIYWKPADGSGSAERLTVAKVGSQFPSAWSPDGRTLFFTSDSAGDLDLWTQTLDSGAKPELLAGGPGNQGFAVPSPDGKWLAYASSYHIFAQPFSSSGAGYPLSREIGISPVWSRDGRQLFFYQPIKSQWMAMDITTGPEIRVSKARVLPIRNIRFGSGVRNFDPAPDGKHFLVVLPAAEGESKTALRPRIEVVLNWVEELKARAPAR